MESGSPSGGQVPKPVPRLTTKTFRPLFLAFVPALCLVGALSSQQVTAESKPAANPQQTAQSFDAFRQQADKLGVRRCANLFSAAGQMLTAGSAYAVHVQTDEKGPDAHVVQGVAGIRYSSPGLPGQAAAIVMAAPVGQGCEGQLVRVAPFQKSCEQVVKDLPAGSAPAADLSGVPLYQLGGNQGQALMIASGASCVVVTIVSASG